MSSSTDGEIKSALIQYLAEVKAEVEKRRANAKYAARSMDGTDSMDINYGRNFENYGRNFENYGRNFENYGRNFENGFMTISPVDPETKKLPNGTDAPKSAEELRKLMQERSASSK